MFPATTKYTGIGGYPGESEAASKVFTVGQEYKIAKVHQGQSNTTLVIEGVKGGWNSVLFDFHDAENRRYAR